MNQTVVSYALVLGAFVVLLVAGYFFIATRVTIIAHRLFPQKKNPGISHIYWIYRYLWLIRLTDNQPIISAILLFQYNRIVDHFVRELKDSNLLDKNVIQISSAFGNVIPRLVGACVSEKTKTIVISDLIENQLLHLESKLGAYEGKYLLKHEDATDLGHSDASFDIAMSFFLLHELPPAKKVEAMREASRVIKSGGKIIIAEFHKPKVGPLRFFGWLYFKTFEPYALDVWEEYAPADLLHKEGTWTDIKKTTYFQDNYQVVVAVKK